MLIPRPRRSPSRRSRWLLATLTALVAAGAASCGKKGAPLPPFAKAPAAPTEVSARRQGERVEIRFTVPTADLDGQHPAHVDRIEVWALTGPVVPPPLFMKYATLVATVPVRKPPPPPPDVKEGEPPPPPPSPSTEPGLDQGQRGIAFDELTSEELLPIAIRELEKEKTREERLKLERLKDAVEPRLSPPDLGHELPVDE